MAEESKSARNAFGTVAPKLAEFTDKLLYGEVWGDESLSQRDRSLVTIVTLIALYRENELKFHIKNGLKNGLTQDEIIATITHTAFYAGWPNAMTAVRIARDAFAEPE